MSNSAMEKRPQLMTAHRRGQLLLITAALLWSIGGALAKLIALPGPTMACYRAAFAALTLLPLLIVRRPPLTFTPAMLGMAACFTAMNLTYVTAITKTTAANAILLQYTAPVWMFVGSVWWLHEPLERRSLAALVLGMSGVAIILFSSAPGDMLGVALGLAAGFFYAGVVLFLRRLHQHDPYWLTFVNHASAGAIGLVLLRLAPELGPLRVSSAELFGLMIFGAVQMALPYVIFSRGLSFVSAQEAGILTLIEPLMNPVITFVAVGEVPSWGTLLGGAAILAGVAVRYVGAAD